MGTMGIGGGHYEKTSSVSKPAEISVRQSSSEEKSTEIGFRKTSSVVRVQYFHFSFYTLKIEIIFVFIQSKFSVH